MITIKNLCVPLFVFLTAFSCDKSKDDDKDVVKVTMCYEETKSSDPWSKGENDTELITNVKNYLLSDTIAVIEISISNDGTFETCKAAYCKTGRKIKALINSNDLDKIKKINFYECK